MNPPFSSWQRELAEAFSSVDALCRHLQIEPHQLPLLEDFKQFPLRVPRGFVDCMRKGDPNDPLLRQVLPLAAELESREGYDGDPVGDLDAVAETGVLHKYHGRVLLIVTGGCAVHCRYCFRRNFPYDELQLSNGKIDEALAYIESHRELREVILSGGDPLLISDIKLQRLLTGLRGLKHIERIRIHSRIPVVLPSRMTDNLLNILTHRDTRTILVLHANHANELSDAVADACERLRQHNITLLNQSVLLRGVNDNLTALCDLSERLFNIGVLPYYLHSLDHATGTGHFEVSESVGKQLVRQMQGLLPGYLVPKFVKEQAGAHHKLPLI